MQAESFNDILKKAQNLNFELEGPSNLPKLQKNLFQILEESQGFLKRQHGNQDNDIFKASLLLGNKCSKIPEIKTEYQDKIDIVDSVISDNNIEDFLKTQRENILFNLIGNSQRLKNQLSENYCNRIINDQWAQDKRKLLLELGNFAPTMIGPLNKPKLLQHLYKHPKEMNAANNITSPSNILSTSTAIKAINKPTSLEQLESSQALQLIEYNYDMKNANSGTFLEKPNLTLLHKFNECANMFGDESVREVWDMLVSVVQLPNDTLQPAKIYRNSFTYQCQHIYNAKGYLEKIFHKYVSVKVTETESGRFQTKSQLETSKLAFKIPELSLNQTANTYNTLRRYCLQCDNQYNVGVHANESLRFDDMGSLIDSKSFTNQHSKYQHQQDGRDLTYDGLPIWQFIYTCMRTGQYSIALIYARYVKHILGETFYTALECLAEANESVDTYTTKTDELINYQNVDSNTSSQTINPNLQAIAGLEMEYKAVKSSLDPYKKACYCIAGRLNYEETFEEIMSKTDDYLWFKLSIVRPENTSAVLDNFDAASTPNVKVDGNKTLNDPFGPDRSFRSRHRASNKLAFSELQNILLKQYGPDYFKAYDKPWLYFRILIMIGQYETAIQFLASVVIDSVPNNSQIYGDVKSLNTQSQHALDSVMLSQAVNLAICLFQARLLQTTKRIDDDLITENRASFGPSYNLNLTRLLGLFVKGFENYDIEEALNYYFTLKDIRNDLNPLAVSLDHIHNSELDLSQNEIEDGEPFTHKDLINNMYVDNAARLIVQTKNFEDICGLISTEDGLKIKEGIIDKLGLYVKPILNLAALEFENKAQYPQAIHLYQISKNYLRLFELMRKLLYGVLSNPTHQLTANATSTQGLITLAENIARIYTSSNQDLYPVESTNFFLLLDLCKFYKVYLTEDYENAIEIIERLKMVPGKKEELANCLENFNLLRDEVRQIYPDILLAAMTMYHKLYKTLKREYNQASTETPLSAFKFFSSTPKNTSTNNTFTLQFMADLKEKANCLLTFTARLPYRLSADVNAKLVEMAGTMS